jgi:hypothetical protein
MAGSTVADLTIDEFKKLVQEAVKETIQNMVSDPDEGLELQDELKVRMQRSLAALQGGDKTVPAHEVAARLGLEW